MAEKILAVFDSSTNYAERFVGYFSGRKRMPFKTIGFSKLSALSEYAQRRKIDILLIGRLPVKNASCAKIRHTGNLQSMYEFAEDITFENLEQFEQDEAGEEERLSQQEVLAYTKKFRSVGKILFLDDFQDLSNNPGHINKYRSMEKISLDLMEIFRYDKSESLKITGNSDVEVCVVYSPECGIISQGFALALAYVMAEKSRVLYINFERFSGLKSIMNADITLSDIIYYFKEKKEKFAEGVRAAAVKAGGFDCIFASEDTEDLTIIEGSEWEVFLEEIADAGGYEIIVSDIGEAFVKPEYLFEISKTIFVPYTTGVLTSKRIEQFEEWISYKGGKYISEKIIKSEIDYRALIKEAPDADYPKCCFKGEFLRAVKNAVGEHHENITDRYQI